MRTEWYKVSLLFLFLVAIIGTLLRSFGFFSIPFEYSHLVHAHSHTAFQGWVYLLMFLLLTKTFLSEEQLKHRRYPLQFKITVFIIFGILISFAVQGYALYSILFSTLFQLLNYWFVASFLRDTRTNSQNTTNGTSLRFIKAGLWFGVLSTILPYGIGILSAKGLNGTEAYRSLVYSFMHLQYNGWFLFIVLGLFYNYLDRKEIPYNKQRSKLFYRFFTLAVIPAISLSLLGMSFSKYLLPIAYLSALLLAVSMIYFVISVPKNLLTYILKESRWFNLYVLVFLLSFALKLLLQCLSVFPFVKIYAFYSKSIIIAYLHLSLLGSISFLLLALLIDKKWLSITWIVKVGSSLLVAGFVVSELSLVLSGFNVFQNRTGTLDSIMIGVCCALLV